MARAEQFNDVEYESLRDELLRADDQVVQLIGFAILAASFLAVAVIQAGTTLTQLFLLAGFNLIVLTLVVKVHEKRGQQGRIAAHLRVFNEPFGGWETRIERFRLDESLRDETESGLTLFDRFSRSAAFGEGFVFTFLSLFAVVGSLLVLPESTIPLGWHITILVSQVVVLALVVWQGQSFRALRRSSTRWQGIWTTVRAREELGEVFRASQDLLVVNGPPAAGKSTLARDLASLLGVDLLAKDDVKERFYDALVREGRLETRGAVDGPVSEEESKGSLTLPDRDPVEMDRAFLDELDDRATEALLGDARKRLPCVIDANFSDSQRGALSRFPDLVEVHISGSPEELKRRYDDRERHPVHIRKSDVDFERIGGYRAMGIPGSTVIPVESTTRQETLGSTLEALFRHYRVPSPGGAAPAEGRESAYSRLRALYGLDGLRRAGDGDPG